MQENRVIEGGKVIKMQEKEERGLEKKGRSLGKGRGKGRKGERERKGKTGNLEGMGGARREGGAIKKKEEMR